MRSSTVVIAALCGVLIAVGGCGSVPNKPAVDGGAGGVRSGDAGTGGSPGSDGVGGAAGVDGATGAGGGGQPGSDGGAGTDGGSGMDGQGDPRVQVRGGIDGIGPAPSTGTIRIVRAGLTFPRARICNGNVCVSGGLAP